MKAIQLMSSRVAKILQGRVHRNTWRPKPHLQRTTSTMDGIFTKHERRTSIWRKWFGSLLIRELYATFKGHNCATAFGSQLSSTTSDYRA